MYGRRAGLPDSLLLSTTKPTTAPTTTTSKTDLDLDDEGDLSLATRALHSPTQSSFSTFNSVTPGRSLLRRSSSYGHGSPITHNHTRKRKQTLTRAHDLPTAVLPPELLERTEQVIDSICIINFDLDSGPEFDNCYPSANYSAKERSLIAFSSFPDHTEKGNSSLTFNWRIPRLPHEANVSNDINDKSLPATSETLYGYVYFSQQKDTSIRRGYAQRSIVIITHNSEWNGLFTKMVNILGPMYFDSKPGHAASVVETAIHNIYKWPSLEPGTVELAFLGHILLVEIPLPHQAQFRTPYNSARTHMLSSTSSLPLPRSLPLPPPSPASIPLLASLPAVPLSQLLRETISQLWLIWELMILAEPILVYSHDPSRCSELVRWLLAMIKPLPFAGDYRPFFHIHTPDFAFILNNNKPRPGTLLGATNPLILSAARHYPHIIRLSAPPARSVDSGSPSSQNGSGSTGGVFGSVSKATASHSFKEAQGTAHGIFSERKRHIKKDTVALKAAEEKLKAHDYAAADAILLQCMSTLTERFLVPLNRYFATLLPADTSDGMSTPQKAASFNQAGFLQSLKTHGTPLPFRRSKMPSMNMNSSNDTTATASAISFYERFLKSPNFLTWLRSRTEITQYTTRARYLQRLETADPAAFLRGKNDSQMEDLQRRLEREARLTEEDLQHAPSIARQRSMSHDVNASGRISPFPTSPSQTDLIKRSERLRSQVQRVKALRQSNQDSDDSDGSSIPSIA